MLNAARVERSSISIEINCTSRDVQEYGSYIDLWNSFLSNFGRHIQIFKAEHMLAAILLDWLLQCPNLQILKVIRFIGRDVSEPRPTLSFGQLREIQWTTVNSRERPFTETNVFEFEQLLGLAPNLETLHISVDLVRAASVAGKGHAVKTLRNYIGSFVLKPHERMKDYWVLYQRVADAGVKLTFASVPNFYAVYSPHNLKCHPRKMVGRKIKKEFHRILKSSQDTLEVLTVPPAKFLDHYFPTGFPMNAVRLLQFEGGEALGGELGTEGHFYFPEGTDLTELFPKLEGMKVDVGRNASRAFPEETFGPKVLKNTVKKLQIGRDCDVERFARLFPSLTHLEINEVYMEKLKKEVFPAICKGWPKLKSLKVFFSGNMRSSPRCNLSLDSCLTGLPEELCTKLYHGRGDECHIISEEEIEKIRAEEASLFQLKALETLEIILQDSRMYGCRRLFRDAAIPFISVVSAKHALKHLPGLKVSVKGSRLGCESFQDIYDALKPVAEFIHLDNHYVRPEFPFLLG